MPLTPISTHQKDSRRSLPDTFPNERDCGSTMCTSAAAEGLRAPHTHLVWNFCTIEYRDPRPSLAPSLLSSSLPPVGVEGYPSCVVARDAMKCRGLSDCVPLHCVRHPLESSEPTNNPSRQSRCHRRKRVASRTVPMCNGATSHSLRSDKTIFLLCPTTVFAPNRWSRY